MKFLSNPPISSVDRANVLKKEKEGIGGSQFDSYWPNFCFPTDFGPFFLHFSSAVRGSILQCRTKFLSNPPISSLDRANDLKIGKGRNRRVQIC